MAFDFKKQLQAGKEAADNLLKNRNEIKDVLKDLVISLEEFLGIELTLEEYVEYEKTGPEQIDLQKVFFGITKPKVMTGFNVLILKNNETEIEQKLFKIKRSKDIYPVTIETDNNRYVSENQYEFAESIGQSVSDSQIHLLLKSFSRKVKEKMEKLPKKE